MIVAKNVSTELSEINKIHTITATHTLIADPILSQENVLLK